MHFVNKMKSIMSLKPKPRPEVPTEPTPQIHLKDSDKRAPPNTIKQTHKLNPGDSVRSPKRGEKLTASGLRELRELIQTRYQLDIEIWEARKVKEFKRDKVIEKMHTADTALLKIKHMIKKWDKKQYFESDEDWEIFQDIKTRIWESGKRTWIGNEPWKET